MALVHFSLSGSIIHLKDPLRKTVRDTLLQPIIHMHATTLCKELFFLFVNGINHMDV